MNALPNPRIEKLTRSNSNPVAFSLVCPLKLAFWWILITNYWDYWGLWLYYVLFSILEPLQQKTKSKPWKRCIGFLCMSPTYASAHSICFVLLKCTFMLAFANCSFYLTQRLIAGTCLSGHGAHQRQNESQQRSVHYSGISSRCARLPL